MDFMKFGILHPVKINLAMDKCVLFKARGTLFLAATAGPQQERDGDENLSRGTPSVAAVFQGLEKGRAGFSKPWKSSRLAFPILGKNDGFGFQALENAHAHSDFFASPPAFSAVKVPEPSMNENFPSVIFVPSSLNLPCQLMGTLLIIL